MTLRDTRTVGSAIAAGTASGGSVMTIQDSEFLASPEGQDVSIVIQDFADPNDRTLAEMGGGRGGADFILKPTSAAILEHPDFHNSGVSAETIADSLMKIRYGSKTYQTVGEAITDSSVPAEAKEQIRIQYLRIKGLVKSKVESLRLQGEGTRVVHFDLNEFLNVSDRLKASRPYYIED